MKLEQLKKIILDKEPYQVQVINRKNTVLLMNTGSDSIESMIEQIDELAKTEPSSYTVHIKLQRNHARDRMLVYENIYFGMGNVIEANHNISPVVTKVDETSIRKTIEAEMRAQRAIETQKQEQIRLTNELKNQISELEKMKSDLQTASGKFAFMLEHFIQSKFMNKMPQALNGGSGNGGNVNLNVSHEQNPNNEINNKIHQSVIKLLTVVTPDQLEVFAETLSKNPALVQTLLTFAKSYS